MPTNIQNLTLQKPQPKVSAALARVIAEAAPMTNAIWAHVSEVEGNPFQYRPEIDPNAPENKEMIASIIENGILQPLPARAVSGKTYKGIKYQTMAGHRRTELSAIAAQTVPERAWIPLVLGDYDDVQAASIAIIENEQRENPSDWATALAIRRLEEESAKRGQSLSRQDLVRKLSKSRTYIDNALGVFELRPELQDIAKRRNGVRSSLFQIQKLPPDADVIESLMEMVDREKPAGFREVESRVEHALLEIKNKKESFRAPDKETQSRSTEYARSGSAATSRGKPLKGNTSKEAFEAVSEALSVIDAKLGTIEHWEPKLTESQRAKLTPQFKEQSRRLEKSIAHG
jgi:ParB/RepB/Spo0J family partition protein